MNGITGDFIITNEGELFITTVMPYPDPLKGRINVGFLQECLLMVY